MKLFVCALIRLWQWGIAPWLGPHCRYEVSCSELTRRAVLERGVLRGLAAGARRILTCHPWGGDGA